jgi:hypothetical protein
MSELINAGFHRGSIADEDYYMLLARCKDSALAILARKAQDEILETVALELDGKMSRKSSAALVRSFKSKIA